MNDVIATFQIVRVPVTAWHLIRFILIIIGFIAGSIFLGRIGMKK